MHNIVVKTKRYIVRIVLVFAPCYAIAQEDLNDFNTWTALELKYDATKKWNFTLEAQLRLKENSTTVDTYFGEFGVRYKLPYNFNIGAGFRYIRENDNRGNIQGYENHIRFNFDLSYRHNIERFKLKYRLRYQNRDELMRTDDVANQRFRFKTTTAYNFRDWKLDPEISGEIFNRLDQNSNNKGFDKFRLGIGTSYKLKKSGQISLFYFYESEFNVGDPFSEHIVRLKYSYSIK